MKNASYAEEGKIETTNSLVLRGRIVPMNKLFPSAF